MKRFLIGLLIVGVAATVVGQGSLSPTPSLAYVDFRNTGVTFWTSDDRLVYLGQVGGEKLVGNNYAAALYYARPDTSELQFVPGSIRLFREPTSTLAGSWATAPTPVVYFPDVAAIEYIRLTLQVRVWDIQRFDSWEAAVDGGGLHGESERFLYVTTPFPALPPPDHWYMHNLRAFAVIPEPSGIVVFLLAAGGLWIVRRQR